MSMIAAVHHLDEARHSIAVAIDHLHNAEQQDADPEVAGKVYATLRTNLQLADLWCEGLVKSRQPDLDRERAAIDEGRARKC